MTYICEVNKVAVDIDHSNCADGVAAFLLVVELKCKTPHTGEVSNLPLIGKMLYLLDTPLGQSRGFDMHRSSRRQKTFRPSK